MNENNQQDYDAMDLEELKEKHEELVNVILTEEEQLIQTHKNVLND